MKGPIILLLVALAVLLVQASSDQALGRHGAVPFRSMATMLKRLAEPMTGTKTEVAKRVYGLLMDTSGMHRDSESSRLNGLTINQLINLNEISLADCDDDKLEERRNTCEKFSTKELANAIRPPKRVMQDGDLMASEKDQINLNLAKYCWKIIEVLGDYCPWKRLETIDDDAMRRLTSFSDEVHSDMKRPKHFFSTNKRPVIVKKLKKLEEKDAEGAKALKETCAFIVNEYKKSPKLFEIDITFPEKAEICLFIDEIENEKDAASSATQSADDNRASG